MAEIGIKFYPKSFVALIDILGFKSIIENSESEEYNMVFQNLTEIVSSQHTYTLTYPEKGKSEFKLNQHQEINYLIISDTIILWSDDTSYPSFYSIVKAVRNIIWKCFKTQYNIALRGAIVMDSVTIFDNRKAVNKKAIDASIIGKAIIKAYELGNSLEWAGCYISPECFAENDSSFELFKGGSSDLMFTVFDDLYFRQSGIVKCNVPFKTGSKEGYAVNWIHPFNVGMNVEESNIKSTFAKYPCPDDQQEKLKQKIENTIAFQRQFLSTEIPA